MGKRPRKPAASRIWSISRNMGILEETRRRSEEGLERLRKEAANLFDGQVDLVVGVNGSYARREATSGSDLDLFFLFENNLEAAANASNEFTPRLQALGFRSPSSGGVFEDPLSISDLLNNIGGREDSNDTITRRMLLLLEGDWIYNRSAFDSKREKIVAAYVPETLRKDQICLFLLNDMIRYWRTICVDFEYKIKAGDKAKAIRLIKLRFSRMLLYFAGVVAVAETHGLEPLEKRARLTELLALPAIERLRTVGDDRANPAIELYCEFLNRLDDKKIRAILDDASPDVQNKPEFSELRELSHKFRDELATLLQDLCPLDKHPLQLALML